MTSAEAPYGDETRAVAHGSSVKFQSDTTAVLVRGRRADQVLGAVLKKRQSTRSAAVKWIAAGVLGLSIIAAVATISNFTKEDSKVDLTATTSSSGGVGTSGVPKVNSQGFQRRRDGEVLRLADFDVHIVSIDSNSKPFIELV
jgi:hypothetical protein